MSATVRQILRLGQVFAPGSETSKDMYVIDRGCGREVVHTCYVEHCIEEYLTAGLIKAYPVPTGMADDQIPYNPEVWAPDLLAAAEGRSP